jgi:hypothetical protein
MHKSAKEFFIHERRCCDLGHGAKVALPRFPYGHFAEVVNFEGVVG